MTAMDRIKLIEDSHVNDTIPVPLVELRYLYRAFKVMRDMAIKYSDDSWIRGDAEEIDKEFEERMKA